MQAWMKACTFIQVTLRIIQIKLSKWVSKPPALIRVLSSLTDYFHCSHFSIISLFMYLFLILVLKASRTALSKL